MQKVMVRAVLVLAISFGVGSAQAQQTARRGSAAYQAKLDEGARKIIEGDRDGAIATLEDAVQMDAARPEAYYLIAEAQRLKGSHREALESFRMTAQRAQEANDPLHRARGLHGVASTLELTEAPIEVVRQAWMELADFSDRNRNVSHPEVARARMRALDAMQELDQSANRVKQRIAERATELEQQQQERANKQAAGAAGTRRQTPAERRAARRAARAVEPTTVPGPVSDTPAVGSEPPVRPAKRPAKRPTKAPPATEAAPAPAAPREPAPAPAAPQ